MCLKYFYYNSLLRVSEKSLCASYWPPAPGNLGCYETDPVVTFCSTDSPIFYLLWRIRTCLLNSCLVGSLLSLNVWKWIHEWFVWGNRVFVVQELLGGQICSWPSPNALIIRSSRDTLTFMWCLKVFCATAIGWCLIKNAPKMQCDISTFQTIKAS